MIYNKISNSAKVLAQSIWLNSADFNKTHPEVCSKSSQTSKMWSKNVQQLLKHTFFTKSFILDDSLGSKYAYSIAIKI